MAIDLKVVVADPSRESGEPMIGGFTIWRNVPITFDKVDTGNDTVQASN